MALRWPEYNAVERRIGPGKVEILLTSKAPNGKQVMAKAKGPNRDAAHIDAYTKLQRKIRRNSK